jgi:hypothetical protein
MVFTSSPATFGSSGMEKVMVPAPGLELAALIASRSEPAPLLLVLVTVNSVAWATAGASITTKNATITAAVKAAAFYAISATRENP